MTTNSNSDSVAVDIEYPVGTFLQSIDVIPGEIVTVALPNDAANLWSPDSLRVQSNSVRAFSTNSQEEFVVYMINREPASSDACLAIPIDALNTKYIVLDYNPFLFPAEFVVTAAFDNTNVTVTPTWSLNSGQESGVPFTVTLHRGDSFYASAATTLTGTAVEATRPVALTNGIQCAQIPVGTTACDHIFEMALPVQSWGKTFAAANLPQRPSGSIYRILAAEAGTNITLLSGGNVDNFMLSAEGDFFESTSILDPIFIESDKPVFVAQYMTGDSSLGATDGDPAMGNVIPIDQYLRHYTFSTIGNTQFNNHYLSIVANNADVGTLTLDGTPIDASNFVPIMDADWSIAVIPLTQGSHQTASSISPHGITVEGYNAFDSYVYPGGANFDRINPAGDTNPPLCSILQVTNATFQGSALDDRASEDTNGNDVIDDGEDLNNNGIIDSDSGIFTVELDASSINLMLQVDSFIPGDGKVNFTATRTDGNMESSGLIVVRDGAGNTCTLDVLLKDPSSMPSLAPTSAPTEFTPTLTPLPTFSTTAPTSLTAPVNMSGVTFNFTLSPMSPVTAAPILSPAQQLPSLAPSDTPTTSTVTDAAQDETPTQIPSDAPANAPSGAPSAQSIMATGGPTLAPSNELIGASTEAPSTTPVEVPIPSSVPPSNVPTTRILEPGQLDTPTPAINTTTLPSEVVTPAPSSPTQSIAPSSPTPSLAPTRTFAPSSVPNITTAAPSLSTNTVLSFIPSQSPQSLVPTTLSLNGTTQTSDGDGAVAPTVSVPTSGSDSTNTEPTGGGGSTRLSTPVIAGIAATGTVVTAGLAVLVFLWAKGALVIGAKGAAAATAATGAAAAAATTAAGLVAPPEIIMGAEGAEGAEHEPEDPEEKQRRRVTEIAVRKLNRGQNVPDYERKRDAFLSLLHQQDGVIPTELGNPCEMSVVYDQVKSAAPTIPVFIGLTQYKDLNTYHSIQNQVKASPQGVAFAPTFTPLVLKVLEPQTTIVERIKSQVSRREEFVDLDRVLPSMPGQVFGYAARDLSLYKSSRDYQKLLREHLNVLAKEPGFVANYQWKSAQNKNIVVGMTIYSSFDGYRKAKLAAGNDFVLKYPPNLASHIAMLDNNNVEMPLNRNSLYDDDEEWTG